VLIAGVSVLSISDPQARVGAALRVVRLFAITAPFALAAAIGKTSQVLLRRLLIAFLVSGALSVALGIWGFVWQLPGLAAEQRFTYPYLGYVYRAGGIFGGSSAYGHLLATWVSISVLMIPLHLRRRADTVLVIIFSLALAGLYSSLSRSAFVNLAVVLTAIFVIRPPGHYRAITKGIFRRSLLISAIPALALLYVAAQEFTPLVELLDQRMLTGLFGAFFSGGDVRGVSSGRISNWLLYIQYLKDNPLTGVGYKALILERMIPPDNNYLQALVETGILGFLCFTGFLLATLHALWIRYHRARDPHAWALLVVWCGQVAHAIFVDIVTFWGSFPVLLAITMVVLRLKSSA
jgi:O-antigen ligase